MTEVPKEEEEKLRDIALRLGVAIGMGPEEVFERLIFALQADTLFRQRQRVEEMKNWWWDKAMLPVYETILEGIPEGSILEERIRLALAMESLKIEIQEALGPIPLRAVYLLARILNFFKRFDNTKDSVL